MRKLKVVFLVSSLGAGGAERVAITLCNEWARRGYVVTLVATFSGGNAAPYYSVCDAIDVISLASLVDSREKTITSSLQRLFVLRRIITRTQADVVVSFLPNVNIAAIVATSFIGVPVVISERRDPVSQPGSWIWELACATFYRYADAVVVQTSSVKESVSHVYSPLKRVICIPNPLPQGIAQYTRTDKKRIRRVLLSVGRLVETKQVEHSVMAFASLAKRHGDWDLHVYGDGPMHTELAALVTELGLHERVLLMGNTTEPWNAMVNADAFVMTSRCEGFPNALLEAMSVGLPCVVYDCPSGPREISGGGTNALLIPLNDRASLAEGLERLFKDASFRHDLGARAKASVMARYDLYSVLREWDEVFRQVGVLA